MYLRALIKYINSKPALRRKRLNRWRGEVIKIVILGYRSTVICYLLLVYGCEGAYWQKSSRITLVFPIAFPPSAIVCKCLLVFGLNKLSSLFHCQPPYGSISYTFYYLSISPVFWLKFHKVNEETDLFRIRTHFILAYLRIHLHMEYRESFCTSNGANHTLPLPETHGRCIKSTVGPTT